MSQVKRNPSNGTSVTLHTQKLTAQYEERQSSAATGNQKATAKSKLSVVYQDTFVKIVSDDKKLTAAQGKALATKIEAAYQFDTQTEGWTNTTVLTRSKLTVEALTKDGFDKLLGGDSTGIAGVTMNSNLMAVPENLTSSTNPDDDDTIAHELDHVQDFREAGKNIDSIPIYEQEGKAYEIGDRYPIQLKEDGRDPALPGIAQALGSYTGADAADVMANYRTAADESKPNGFRNEIMGSLYVEYLRTRLNGSGVPDALQRLAQVTADVGKGSTYDAAFKKQFGTTPKATEDGFVAYVKATEGNPAERLKGTLWGPYLKAGTSKS